MYVIFHIIRFILSCSIGGSWWLEWNWDMLEEWHVRLRSLFSSYKVNFCVCIWGEGGGECAGLYHFVHWYREITLLDVQIFQIAFLNTLLISSFGGRLSLSLQCQECLAPYHPYWEVLMIGNLSWTSKWRKKSNQKCLFLQSLQRKIVRPSTSTLLVLAQIFLVLA